MGGEDEKQMFCSVLHVSLFCSYYYLPPLRIRISIFWKEATSEGACVSWKHKILYWNMVAMYWTFQMLQLIISALPKIFLLSMN